MAEGGKNNEIVRHSVGYIDVVERPPTHERARVSWEDKTTGEYYRHNSSEKISDTEYRRYENVSFGNKNTGYSGKYYAEEKFPINGGHKSSSSSNSKGSKSSSKGSSYNKYVDYY